jgi:hypothetical protein
MGNPKLEIRNSKLVACRVTPAEAEVYKRLDSRLRGNDARGRFSSFDFRISSFGKGYGTERN